MISKCIWQFRRLLVHISVLVVLASVCIGVDADLRENRVLLQDVSTLTLSRDNFTTGQRFSPLPQLNRVGGTATKEYLLNSVECLNRGFDGIDVQWECKAKMPEKYEFGKIDVSCEGYEYPNDPYVLAGSCALNYELDDRDCDEANNLNKLEALKKAHDDSGFYLLICFPLLLVICFGLCIFEEHHADPRNHNQPAENTRQNGSLDPPPTYKQAVNQGATVEEIPIALNYETNTSTVLAQLLDDDKKQL